MVNFYMICIFPTIQKCWQQTRREKPQICKEGWGEVEGTKKIRLSLKPVLPKDPAAPVLGMASRGVSFWSHESVCTNTDSRSVCHRLNGSDPCVLEQGKG